MYSAQICASPFWYSGLVPCTSNVTGATSTGLGVAVTTFSTSFSTILVTSFSTTLGVPSTMTVSLTVSLTMTVLGWQAAAAAPTAVKAPILKNWRLLCFFTCSSLTLCDLSSRLSLSESTLADSLGVQVIRWFVVKRDGLYVFALSEFGCRCTSFHAWLAWIHDAPAQGQYDKQVSSLVIRATSLPNYRRRTSALHLERTKGRRPIGRGPTNLRSDHGSSCKALTYS